MKAIPKALLGLLLFCALVTVPTRLRAQVTQIGVDRRIELFGVIFRLAGSPEFSGGRVRTYNEAIERHFSKFKDHDAVRIAAELRAADGVGYDAVMNLALFLKDDPSLEERVPLDRPGIRLDGRWHGAKARRFLEAVRRFVVDSKFRDFLESQQRLYALTDRRLKAFAESNIDSRWFRDFFGGSADRRLIVTAGLSNGSGNYGVGLKAEDGVEEACAILGVWVLDDEGMPQFPDRLRDTAVHEFAHSYSNPVVDQFAAPMLDAASRVFEPVKEPMRQGRYAGGITLLYESLVRAVSARYVLAHSGAGAGRVAIAGEHARGFIWTNELVDLLGQYEADRVQYPALESFMPKVVAFFNGLAPRIDEMVRGFEANRPKLVSVSPAGGTVDVDPSLRRLEVRFDQPMLRDVKVIEATDARFLPKLGATNFDASGTALTIEVQLEPDHQYELVLARFCSAGLIPFNGQAIRFRTRR